MKHLALVGALVAALVAVPVASCFAGTAVALTRMATEGVFDPSLADTPAGSTLWISYSTVAPSPQWAVANPRVETTRLASSPDGVKWTDAGVTVNPFSEVKADPAQRTWVSEVSSLVYDKNAASSARWKLFWHHYSVAAGNNEFGNGWLGYKQAATPAGLATAPEIKLLAGMGYSNANNIAGGPTGSPVGGAPVLTSSALHSTDCIAFTEPGAMVNSRGIYLAVTCMTPNGSRIILLKCAAPCSNAGGANWSLVGTILQPGDAASFGGTMFNAPDLFMRGSTAYLAVTPASLTGAYSGCDIFTFANLDAATLVLNGAAPRLINKISGTAGSFNGACTAAQNDPAAAGYLYSELKPGIPMQFQIVLPGTFSITP